MIPLINEWNESSPNEQGFKSLSQRFRYNDIHWSRLKLYHRRSVRKILSVC